MLSPSIVALVENKVKLAKVRRIEGCVPGHWLSCHNFNLSPRWMIWIAWNFEV